MRLNAFSYYADFVISIALIVSFAAGVIIAPWRTRAEWLAYAALGCVIWTFIEYVIHRWVYHRLPYFQEAHAAHHAEPNAFFGAPPTLGVLLIVLVIYAPLMANNPLVANGLTSGVLIGYCAYQLLHHADHHWASAPGTWLYRARHLHALHHVHSEHVNYGITTLLWDRAFGTLVKARQHHVA